MTAKAGLFGWITMAVLNLFSILSAEEHLKIISLVMAIIVSFLTAIWYISNLIMKRREIVREIKLMFPKLFKHKKQ